MQDAIGSRKDCLLASCPGQWMVKGMYKYNELNKEENSGWMQVHFWEVVMVFDGITLNTIHSLSHKTMQIF